MSKPKEGDLLWAPSDEVRAKTNLTRYMNWLASTRGLDFGSYQELWSWSVNNLGEFWHSLWDYFEIKASQPPNTILADDKMPGASWFVGAELNYAENFFVRSRDEHPAIVYVAEKQSTIEIGWPEIYAQSNALAQALRGLGVGRGDRVVAYMPNIPETIIALFAVASLGAIWSSCSPDFGSRSVLDRFQQIEPKVLLAVDGYVYNGKSYDRRNVVAELQAGLPTVERTILVPLVSEVEGADALRDTVLWADLLASADLSQAMSFEQVPFDHPLWVLYSSGTTGLPKPIVQGHGGILLEHFKMVSLHLDLKPEDRFFWYTSTGWMMWNFLVGGLLTGCTIVTYNGSPGYPSLDVLWELAEETGITYFGTSAAFVSANMNAEIRPSEKFDLRRIRAVGSTGSPLSVDGFNWIYDNVNQSLALESVSGGTDLCTAFVGGCRLLPIHNGEIQGAALGAKVQAFDEGGNPVIDEVGELVIAEPMPSMPLYFWNDPGDRRYIASYFDMFPGVWRHGDWIKFNQRGGCVIYGRSDSTINRQGVRMGTSEIYRVVESMPEVLDSLVVDLEILGGRSFMPLFVMLQPGVDLDDGISRRIKQAIRENVSPRHVPDEIIEVEEIPYTLSGKKMEVPIRRILLGHAVEKAANPGAMRNPGSIDFFVRFARALESRNAS